MLARLNYNKRRRQHESIAHREFGDSSDRQLHCIFEPAICKEQIQSGRGVYTKGVDANVL